MAHISKQFARFGLTTVHHEGGNFSALMQVRQDGELLHRVSYEADQPMLDAMIANGWRTGFGDEWIRLGATSEHMVDGSFSERTMSIRAGYPGRRRLSRQRHRPSRRTSTRGSSACGAPGSSPTATPTATSRSTCT